MNDEQKAPNEFRDWAIVDVMGHARYAGFVTTEAYGQAVLFRIDVPPLQERTSVTKRSGYRGGLHYPAGATVTEGAVQGYTKLIGAGSIYSITPCTEEACLAAVEEIQPRPLQLVSLPSQPEKAIAAAADSDADNPDYSEESDGVPY